MMFASIWIFLLLFFSVPVNTPLSPVYYVKIIREYNQSKFVFGDQDLAYWHFTLAAKRIVEAKTLKTYGYINLAQTQFLEAKSQQEHGKKYLDKLIDVVNTNYLQQMYAQNQNALDK